MTTALLSRRVGPVPLQRLLRVGLAGLPVIFAVPILVALVQGIANIVAQGHPFFGDISGTATDARAITLGSPLYQDPAAGYTPLVYPPVMTLLSAGLDELKAWDGWTVILSIAQLPCICCMFRWMASDVCLSSSAGLNWTYSVPASTSGLWPAGT